MPAPRRVSRPVSGAPHRCTHRSSTLRSEEHTSELQSQSNLVCRLLLEKKKTTPAPDGDDSRLLSSTCNHPPHKLLLMYNAAYRPDLCTKQRTRSEYKINRRATTAHSF